MTAVMTINYSVLLIAITVLPGWRKEHSKLSSTPSPYLSSVLASSTEPLSQLRADRAVLQCGLLYGSTVL